MGNYSMMPKLGMTMTEGLIVRWLVKEGDKVAVGDNIFEVETDKTTLEVDCLEEGVILKTYYPEGATVPCNTPVAYIGTEGETAPELDLSKFMEEAPAAAPEKAEAPAAKPEQKEEPTEPAHEYDLTVIGAGPGGYVAAIRAAQLGKKVVLVERDTVGGTCLNRGCIPTKSLYACAKEWRAVNNAGAFGITAEKCSFDWAKINERTKAIVKQLTGGVSGLLKKNGVKVVEGDAKVLDAHTVKVGTKILDTAYLLLATGTKPATVLKNIGDIEIMDTNEALFMEELPKSICIVGGGVIGVEMANILNAFGVDVTIVELMDTILPMVDAEVAAAMKDTLVKNGVKVLNGVSIKSGEKKGNGLLLTLTDGSTLECEKLLEAVGRQIVGEAYEDLNLDKEKKGFVKVSDETLQTSIPTVYAIGDITGRQQLAHVASEQGVAAVEHMFLGKKASAHPVPACIFTQPEIASVGMTEKEARDKGLAIKTAKFPFVANGKALTLGETEGFVKVIADERYGEILGVHIIGPEASNLISEAVVAMDAECTVESLGEMVHAHPTLAEAVKEAVLGVSTGMIHF